MKLICFILISTLLLVSLIVFHEVTHAQIMEYFDVPYEYGLLSEGSFAFVRFSRADCNDTCLLANSINEIVGYNVMPFLLILILVFLLKEETYSKYKLK